MSQGRIRLLIAGTIALLLLSSFSVWRIYRDGKRIDSRIREYSQLQNCEDKIQDLTNLVLEMKGLSIVKASDYEVKSKVEMQQLLDVEYPRIKAQTIDQFNVLGDPARKKIMEDIISNLDILVSRQKYINTTSGDKTADTTNSHDEARSVATLMLKMVRANLRKDTQDAMSRATTEIDSADEVSLLLSILMFTSGIIGLTIVVSGRNLKEKIA